MYAVKLAFQPRHSSTYNRRHANVLPHQNTGPAHAVEVVIPATASEGTHCSRCCMGASALRHMSARTCVTWRTTAGAPSIINFLDFRKGADVRVYRLLSVCAGNLNTGFPFSGMRQEGFAADDDVRVKRKKEGTR